jgi:hypothetical protein
MQAAITLGSWIWSGKSQQEFSLERYPFYTRLQDTIWHDLRK